MCWTLPLDFFFSTPSSHHEYNYWMLQLTFHSAFPVSGHYTETILFIISPVYNANYKKEVTGQQLNWNFLWSTSFATPFSATHLPRMVSLSHSNHLLTYKKILALLSPPIPCSLLPWGSWETKSDVQCQESPLPWVSALYSTNFEQSSLLQLSFFFSSPIPSTIQLLRC